MGGQIFLFRGDPRSYHHGIQYYRYTTTHVHYILCGYILVVHVIKLSLGTVVLHVNVHVCVCM